MRAVVFAIAAALLAGCGPSGPPPGAVVERLVTERAGGPVVIEAVERRHGLLYAVRYAGPDGPATLSLRRIDRRWHVADPSDTTQRLHLL